jgi:hypothetical protein
MSDEYCTYNCALVSSARLHLWIIHLIKSNDLKVKNKIFKNTLSVLSVHALWQ